MTAELVQGEAEWASSRAVVLSMAAGATASLVAVEATGLLFFPERGEYFVHSQAVKLLESQNARLRHDAAESGSSTAPVIAANAVSITQHYQQYPHDYMPTVDTLVSGSLGLLTGVAAFSLTLRGISHACKRHLQK